MLLGFVACDVVPIEMAKDVDALPALQARAWSEVRAFEVLQTAECDRASFAVRLGGASSSTGYTLVGEPGTLSVAIEGSPYVDTILVVYPMTDPAATTPPEALFVDDDGGDGGLSAIDGVELTGWEADAPRSALGHLVLSRWEGDAESDLRLTVSIDGVALCPLRGRNEGAPREPRARHLDRHARHRGGYRVHSDLLGGPGDRGQRRLRHGACGGPRRHAPRACEGR